MKFYVLFFTILVAFLSSAQASTHRLEPVKHTAKILGGAVLILGHGQSLVINGDLHSKVTKEIGKKSQSNLYRDFLNHEKSAELFKKYVSSKHMATRSVIQQYEKLIANEKQLTLR